MSTPRFALTDDALRLLLHAERSIAVTKIYPSARSTNSLTSISNRRRLHGSTVDVEWRRETAILRLVSTVEAFIDAASTSQMSRRVEPNGLTIEKLLEDFAKDSSMSWNKRCQTYSRYHGFGLEQCDGWKELNAGIDVRNCLAHGLGGLTPHLRRKKNLHQVVQVLDVSVGGNRMHLTPKTVPLLGDVCRRFVTSVDSKLP